MIEIDIINQSNNVYEGSLLFGTPLHGSDSSRFIFDTGSGWLAVTSVECNHCKTHYYNQTSSRTSKTVDHTPLSLDYGIVKLNGTFVADRVCLRKGICVSDFGFLKITKEIGLYRINGILGLAPDENGNGPSFIGAMRDEGLIDEEIATFWLNDNSIGSKVTFGGVLSDAIDGPLYDLKLDQYNHEWWTVDITSGGYGELKFTNVTKAILDTGTSFILLAESDYL